MEESHDRLQHEHRRGSALRYINPDQTTVEYLRGRPFAPNGEAFEKAAKWWLSLASSPVAQFDDRVTINGSEIEPTVTWGINQPSPSGSMKKLRRQQLSRKNKRASRKPSPTWISRTASDQRPEDRRRLHRLLHQWSHLRPPRSAKVARAESRSQCPRPRRPGSQLVRVQAEARA